MEDSIFTKIIKGELPCHKVYEDDTVIAFLDIAPFTTGHTLVVPKQQVDSLWDLEEESYQQVMAVAKKVANRIKTVIKPKRVGMALEGFDVPHAHVHIFGLEEGLKATMVDLANRKLSAPDHTALAELAKKLQF